MVGANVVSGCSQAAIAALLITGTAEIWHLAALAALNGGAGAFFFPASAGVLPPVAVEAASFLHDLGAGWREFRSRTWLWVIVLQFSFLLMVCTGALAVLGPVVADEELGGAKAWGAILAAEAAGFLAGGLLGLRFRPRRMLLAATVAILAFPLLPLALAFPLALPAIHALGFAAGLGAETFGVLWHTTIQQEIPPDKLSRVYSYDALGSIGLVPVGYVLAGPIAEAIGVRATLAGAAAIGIAVTLPVLAVRDVQRLERHPAT